MFIDELLLLLLKLQLCEAVRPGELSSCADRCHFVTLNDLVYLLRVRLVVMQSACHTLKASVLQDAARSTAHFMRLFGVVVAAPILFIALATVAVVHVAI